MVEQIKGLEIEGRKFQPKKTLNFFEPTSHGAKPQRLALVYGRNGTGKSTIASAFRHVNPDTVDARLKVAAIKDDDSLIPLPNEVELGRAAFRVFDERYVDTKIKLVSTEDGLGTIVLLSEQGNSQTELDAVEKLKALAQGREKALNGLIAEFDDVNKTGSKRHIFETIRGVLKRGWAQEDQQVRSLSRKTNVDDNLVNEIGSMQCLTKKEDISASKASIGKQLKELEDVGDPTAIPEVERVENNFDETTLVAKLNKRIEKPELTDREKKILAIYESLPGRVESASATFSSGADLCPYCFRPIDANERNSLIESINKILNKDVDDYKKELALITFPTISFDKNVYRALGKDLVDEVDNAVVAAKAILEAYQADVSAKRENVFSQTTYPVRDLATAISFVNTKLAKLEKKRQELITRADQKKSLIKELARLTREQAHYLIAPMYLDYLKQERMQGRKRRLLAKIQKIIAWHDNKIETIKAKMQGTDLAVKCINESLSYIYSSPTRFEISVKDNKYVLKSHGNDIRPCDVSTGERHALALAYFFVDIMANHEVKKFYTDEMLLLIDDPVSSFDNENKIGVFSFLMRMFDNVLAGNQSSRIILMTHDMHTMVQMSKAGDTVIKELLKAPKGSIRFLKIDYDGEIAVFNPEGYNEYSALLMDVFQFAKNGDSALCAHAVGNEIRRILEGYSTFLYRKDFLALFYDSMTKSKLGEFAAYYETRMARTVLHGESHMMFQAQAFSSSGNFFAETEDDERQQIAKDVLVLLYILDSEHLKSHFEQMRKDQRYAKLTPIAEIESWKQSIKQSIQVKATV